VGGIPEVVVDGETGMLVEPRQPRQMASAVVRLLKSAAARREMGEAGRARVLARFTVERMVGETMDVYERVAGTVREAGRGRPPAAG